MIKICLSTKNPFIHYVPPAKLTLSHPLLKGFDSTVKSQPMLNPSQISLFSQTDCDTSTPDYSSNLQTTISASPLMPVPFILRIILNLSVHCNTMIQSIFLTHHNLFLASKQLPYWLQSYLSDILSSTSI